jgi:hypothetical protein
VPENAITLELGTPTIGLARTWHPINNGMSQEELFVPVYIFPVKPLSDANAKLLPSYYYQPTSIMVPLVKELLVDADKPIKLNNKTIRRIGLCTGSGGSMIEGAKRLGAEAFYTGEANHHQQLLAQALDVELIVEGHRQTEEIFMEPLGEKLKEVLPELEIEVYRG